MKKTLLECTDSGEAKLSCLIKNATQSLTHSVKKEETAVERESLLLEMTCESLLIKGNCTMNAPFHTDAVKTSTVATADGHTTGDLEPYLKSS